MIFRNELFKIDKAYLTKDYSVELFTVSGILKLPDGSITVFFLPYHQDSIKEVSAQSEAYKAFIENEKKEYFMIIDPDEFNMVFIRTNQIIGE